MILGSSIDVHGEVVFLKMHEKSEINSDKIILNDITDIYGADSEFIKRLGSIIIGNSPLPGETRNIDLGYVEMRLKQNGFDPSKIKIEMQQSCEVKRGFVKIDRKKIEKSVVDYIYRSVPWEKEQIVIKQIRSSRDFILPKGNISFKFETSGNNDFIGKTPITVFIIVDDIPIQKTIVTADIGVFSNVVLTKNPIRRYMRIKVDDLYTKRMDLADLPSGYILNYDDVIGMRATRNINPNVILRNEYLEIPPLIKKGDIVSIIAESNDLRITTIGIAKEKGKRGSRIIVENISSKKEIYAYIVDESTVKVEF